MSMSTRLLQAVFRNAAMPFLAPLASFFLLNHEAAAQNFWQQTNGPYGGVITALNVDVNNGNIFAGTNGSGIFRSTDNGASWVPVNNGLTKLGVNVLAISAGRIFAGTSDGGVFRSTDNGASWMQVNSGLNNPSALEIFALTVHFTSGHIFAGTDNGVYRSTNNGDSWTPINTGLTNLSVRSFAIFYDIYVGTKGGVFRSANNGDSWTPINAGLTNTKVEALLAISGQRLLAGTPGGVFRSTNNGASWTPIKTGLTNTNVRSLARNSNGDILAGTYGDGIFRSMNEGDSWTPVNIGLSNTIVNALAVNLGGQIFAGTFGAGIFRSNDNGSSWAPVNTGIINTSVRAFAMNSAGQIFAGASSIGISRSDNNGETWTPVNTGLTDLDVSAIAINSSGHIFAGTENHDLLPTDVGGGVFRSTNNGGSWAPVNAGLTNTDVRALAINSSGHIFVGAEGSGVFRSMNNGASWIATNTGLTSTSVRVLAINSSGHIFAGTSDAGVFRSVNNGGNWVAINNGLARTSVYSLAINASENIFAGTSEVVYRSSDNGDSWTRVNIGFTANYVQALAINLIGHVFAGTIADGVFRSMDNGGTWTPLNTGLTYFAVSALAVNSGAYIFAGTFGSGIFRSIETTGAVPTATTDAATNLSSNSARLNGRVNPNNLSTTVKFQYGSSTSYGSEMVATPSPVNGTSEVTINANISGLVPGITYHFRVVATNTVGTTNSADRVFTTSGAAPTISTSAATNIGPYSATLSGMVNPNGRSTELKFQYGITTSYGREATIQDSVRGTTPVPASMIVMNLFPNTIYHYRLVAINDAGTTNGNDQTFTTLLPAYPQNVALNTTINFPAFSRAGDFRAVDYQLAGLPGNSDSSVAKYLRGNHKKDWQVYWDNGAASNFLVEYDGGPEFNFKAGRAFWIIHKGALVFINRAVPAAPLSSSAPLTSAQIKMPLHSGWNLISNPYTRSVAWARIRDANNVPTPKVTDPIWAFNQTYSQADSLKPYIGYYFYNRHNLDTLKIPYTLYYPPASAPATVVEPNLWRVHIALSSGEFIEKAASFGVSREASPELDVLDFRKPRAIATIPSVSFNRSAWDKSYGIFATDIRPEFEEQESWDFEVQSAQREPVKLTFSSIERIPAHFAVYLIDEARARSVNLREDSLYSFTPATDIAKFTVRVGKTEALQKDLDALIPKEFALEQNFPNPFNPTTAVPVTVPVTTEVKLKVYNLLGKEVKTLHNGSLEPGRHFFNWDGRDETGNMLGTGVYFYRLTTGTRITFTKKMILVK